MQAGQLKLDMPGYHQYWNYAEKKGYSGTAVFTKEEPLGVVNGIGIEAVSYTHLDVYKRQYVFYPLYVQDMSTIYMVE